MIRRGVHLCTGLRPIPGSLFSEACPRQVMAPLGRCPVCRPERERKPAAKVDRVKANASLRAWRARRAQAGLSPAMEGA